MTKTNTNIATSEFAIALASENSKTAPEWIHVFRHGINHAELSNKTYNLNDIEMVIFNSSRNGVDLVIDYEHSTATKAPKGEKSPAAGWIKALETRDNGLWAKVEWTPKAKAMIEAGEYRYFSPGFLHTPNDFNIERLIHGGLTNTPALQLTALARADAETENTQEQPKETKMSAFEKLMLKLCNTERQDGETDELLIARCSNHLKGGIFIPKDEVVSLASALQKDKLDDPNEMVKSVTALASEAQRPDPLKYSPNSVVDELKTALASLSGRLEDFEKQKHEQKVQAAVKNGQLVPAQRDWAMALASEQLDAYLKTAPKINLDDHTTAGQAGSKGDNPLTSDQMAICSAMGLSQEEFKNNLKAATGK